MSRSAHKQTAKEGPSYPACANVLSLGARKAPGCRHAISDDAPKAWILIFKHASSLLDFWVSPRGNIFKTHPLKPLRNLK